MLKIIGEKKKMISFFLKNEIYPCTIIYCKPNKIVYKKKINNNNYTILLGYDKIKKKKQKKPLIGFFKKYKSKYYKKIIQINNIKKKEINFLKEKKINNYINLRLFKKGEKIDVTGYTIGKGFQGVVKRHNFSGVGEKTHGQHNRLRAPGSIGAGSSPSRVFKGMKMAGRMGNIKKTIKNLKIIKIDLKKNILLVKGSIPGKYKYKYIVIKKWNI